MFVLISLSVIDIGCNSKFKQIKNYVILVYNVYFMFDSGAKRNSYVC